MWLLLACTDPDDAQIRTPKSGDPADTQADDTAADTAAATDTDTDTDTDTVPPDPCLEDAPDPGAPARPDALGTLTVTVRTADTTYAGTEDEAIVLCVTATDCFPLTQADHPGLEAGGTGVWSFEALGLDRAAVDRVELRTTAGDNAWTPACIDLRFDGEPVYCEDAPGFQMGSEGGAEVTSWTDPAGLHADCGTCWDATLTHGPLLGALTTDTARVWVRTDATRPVALLVADNAAMLDERVAAWAYPAAADDFTATLVAECLEPGATYWYEVLVDGLPVMDRALPFTTPPARGTGAEARLTFGSCTKEAEQPAFASALADAPDLFVFAGDNHYANSSDLGSIRWFYRWSLEREERADLVARVPTVATWDDHDFLGNDTLGTAPGREDTLRAFTEYWANPSYGLPGAPGVYTALAWGDVDVFLLDDRYSRGVDPASMLGAAQYGWLVDALLASDATFKFVVSGSQWSDTGRGDSWYEFRDERTALFDALAAANVGGVVLVSGDIHRSELRLLDREGAYDLPEITSSPMAQTSITTCASDDAELVACYAAISYVTVDVDTRLADPTLTATLRDVNGAERASWTLLRSELE